MYECSDTRKGPSRAWRDSIFNSPPRRDPLWVNHSTTRVQVDLPMVKQKVCVEGNREATALLLLKHLWQHGTVKRLKVQPFSLDELGGPVGRIPDFLVELADGALVVIQVKVQRFITQEVQARFDLEREFLEARGFRYLVWTDKNWLANPVSTNVRSLDRGERLPIDQSTFDSACSYARSGRNFGQLLSDFGLDKAIAAMARGAAFVNVLEQIDEHSNLLPHFPDQLYARVFSDGDAPEDFWHSLGGGTDPRPSGHAKKCHD